MNDISGGVEPVSAAVSDELLVVSAAPGWTEHDWQQALEPHQHLDAYLVGTADESDGTEIYIFRIAKSVAA